MKIVQRASAWIGWALLVVLAVLFTLEATGTIGYAWRVRAHQGIDWLLAPTLRAWAVALIGAAVAVLGVLLVVAQFVPVRRSLRPLRVDSPGPGSTLISATAVYRSVERALVAIDGVFEATPILHPRRVEFRVGLADGANAATVADRAGEELGDAFWSSLGVEPRPVHLIMTYGKSATQPLA